MNNTHPPSAHPSLVVPALVVEPGLADVLLLVPVLSSLGFQVTATESFNQARQSLRVPPTLLITEIRLGEFNGLHLVLRGKSVRKDMSAIVTSEVEDPVLRDEAEAMGAIFVRKPTTSEEMRAAIERTLARDRAGSTNVIRAPFERRSQQRRHAEVSAFSPDRRRIERRIETKERLQQLPLH